MKKFLVLYMLMFLLTGCSNSDENEFTIKGKYMYDECVYINFLSSSTKDYLREQYSNVSYIDIDSKEVIHFINEGSNNEYSNVVFRETSYEEAIGQVSNLDFENTDIVSVFDIYSNDEFTGLSIIVSEDGLYIVEAKFLGSNSSYFVWQIFSLKLSG